MRLSADATRYAYVAGKGADPPSPLVTVVDADGTVVALEAGHDPRWEFGDSIVFRPQTDGVVRFAGAPRWSVGAVDLAAGNEITAAAGRIAVSRTDPPRILCSWRPPILGATHPVLSDDGEWLVYRRADFRAPHTSTLILEPAAPGSRAPRDLWTGEPTKVRAGGRTFVWQIGQGRIAGIADAGNAHLEAAAFNVPGWALFEPVPIWHTRRGELGVLFLADDGRSGHIYYATWGSLQAGTPIGRYLGASTGAGYEHDARPLGLHVRVLWLSGAGLPVDRDVDLEAPRAELKPPLPVVVTPPPPPAIPPPNEADYAFVPDGTLITGALRMLVGDTPSRQGDVICLHKNIDQAEWRRLFPQPDGNIRIAHWADASRGWAPPHPMAGKPDPGWWAEPAPTWAMDTFRSGESFVSNGTIVDLVPGAGTNRWTQKVTLYGLKHGGICVRFDPRFEGQYDHGPQRRAMYEFTFNPASGRTRFEEWCTPIAAKGQVPWGDTSRDVRLRQLTDPPPVAGPPSAPKPFKPCPRPLVSVPPEVPPVSDKTHNLADIDAVLGDDVPEDLFLGAMVRYRNEVCLERDRVGAPEDDKMTGGAMLFFSRGFNRERNRARFRGANQVDAAVAGFLGATKDYRRAVGIQDPQ